MNNSSSSSGVYGTLHMAMEMLSHSAGINFKHVPYSGAGPALTAILGGHVDTLASGPAVVIPHIKGGKLRPLAGWGAKRVVPCLTFRHSKSSESTLNFIFGPDYLRQEGPRPA